MASQGTKKNIMNTTRENLDKGINLGQFLIFIGLVSIAIALFFVGLIIANKVDDLILVANEIAAVAT